MAARRTAQSILNKNLKFSATKILGQWLTKLNNGWLRVYAPIVHHFDFFNFIKTGYKYPIFEKNWKKFSFIELFSISWKRVAFRGKSFRVRNFKKKGKVILNFGYSHWTRVKLTSSWALIKRRRQSYVWFTGSPDDFKDLARNLPNIKRYNPYTMRGFRFKKQAIIRRFGKISQHISILH